MRFTQILVAAATAALSQAVIITNPDFSGIAVGVEFDVGYSGSEGTTTLYLATGTSDNVVKGAVIGTSSSATGTIPWTPTEGGSFAFVIEDSGSPESSTNPNYSQFFTVSGGSSSSTTTSSGSTTTGTGSTTTGAPTTTTVATTTPAGNSTTTLATLTTTGFKNSTTSTTGSSSKTKETTGSSSSSSPSTTSTQVPSSMAAGIASPLAFVLLALAALVTLN